MSQQPSAEQMKALQEKIKNMSPEELREFQRKQCIFCHILSGKIPSKKVYEDEQCTAILDINPVNPGHLLLLPKEHYGVLPQLPEDVLGHIFIVAKRLSQALLKGMDAKGTNVVVANGIAAGQRAQHLTIHIIPRYEGDESAFDLPQKQQDEKELHKLQEKLSTALGMKKEDKPLHILSIPKHIKEAEHEHHHERKKAHEAKAPQRQKKEEQARKRPSETSLDDLASLFAKRSK